MIEELEDRWILGLRGIQVIAVSRTSDFSEYVVTLVGGIDLFVNGQVQIAQGPATAAKAVRSIRPLGQLVGATVVSAVAFKSGVLRIVFSTGHHLNVRGDESEIMIRIKKPGDFEYVFRGGVGTMKIIRSNLDPS